MSSMLVASAVWAGAAHASCQADKVTITGPFGEAQFSVDIVDTPETRAVGLMNVPEMGRFTGMLFIYDQPQPTAFWMRNTLIPLDMLFADQDGVIVKVHENAIPLDETPIFGGDAIQYVLEINGGMSAILGIQEGAQMHHPRIQETDDESCS